MKIPTPECVLGIVRMMAKDCETPDELAAYLRDGGYSFEEAETLILQAFKVKQSTN